MPEKQYIGETSHWTKTRVLWCLSCGFFFLLLAPFWYFIFVPELTKLPQDFYYKVELDSQDNFYNEENKGYDGEIKSKTNFFYQVVSVTDDAYLVRNVFDVRTPAGQPIFAVERLYGIDPKSGRHMADAGDHTRTGYLFAPKKNKQINYIYWHVNYDEPAYMRYIGEEDVEGLKTYRYQARYKADQTENLGHLPGVPEERGVELDIELNTWVEPVTGKLVKYEDNTIAYYYNQKNKERLIPWNKFSNKYTEDSVKNTVKEIKQEKSVLIIYLYLIPVVLIIFGLLFIVPSVIKNQRIKKLKN